MAAPTQEGTSLANETQDANRPKKDLGEKTKENTTNSTCREQQRKESLTCPPHQWVLLCSLDKRCQLCGKRQKDKGNRTGSVEDANQEESD